MKITLATLKDATPQQVFDQVAQHLLSQKEPCTATTITGRQACSYRSDDGTKSCAAGCLISDEEMKDVRSLNLNTGYGWERLTRDLGKKYGFGGSHSSLIQELQLVHDECAVDEWLDSLESVASSYDLSAKVLDAYRP